MSDDRNESQEEMIRLLRLMLEELQKTAAYREAIAQSLGDRRPDHKAFQEENERTVQEFKKESEERRQEELAYRSQLFTTLDRLIEVLSQISTKLEKQGSSD